MEAAHICSSVDEIAAHVWAPPKHIPLYNVMRKVSTHRRSELEMRKVSRGLNAAPFEEVSFTSGIGDAEASDLRSHAKLLLLPVRCCLAHLWQLWNSMLGMALGRILIFFLIAPSFGLVIEYLLSRCIAAAWELLSESSIHSTSLLWSPFQNVSFIDAKSLPLHTSGRWVVDKQGQRVPLRCVNWYGAHLATYAVGGLHRRSLSQLAVMIRALGFNCVRLPYSLELQLSAVRPPPDFISANPTLVNKSGLEILDAAPHPGPCPMYALSWHSPI